jgi:hypothetical protein
MLTSFALHDIIASRIVDSVPIISGSIITERCSKKVTRVYQKGGRNSFQAMNSPTGGGEHQSLPFSP